MNAYTPIGEATIQHRDISAALRTNRCTAAAHLAALERHRRWHAEAELNWMLKQSSVHSQATTSHVAMLRRAISAALIGAGQRIKGVSQRDDLANSAATAGTLGASG